MPTFSIIIPHKNCPELLSRCIGSIPESDDIEIILVDDNSDDQMKFENYLNLIHHKNLHVIKSSNTRWAGGSRNLGLDVAQGKWILFLDADDYFLDNAFTLFTSSASLEDDIVYFKHISVYSDTLSSCARFPYRNDAIIRYIGNPNQRHADALMYGDIVPWGKLLRRSMIEENNIRFDEIPCCEDVMFITKCANSAKKISANDNFAYCVTYRPSSLMMNFSKEKDWVNLLVSLERNHFLKAINKKKQMIRLFSLVFRAFRRYGLSESNKYVREIWKNDHSLFEGNYFSWYDFKDRIIRIFRKDVFQA